MARVRIVMYKPQIQALRYAPGTRREVDRAAKGMARLARVYASDLRETGELLEGLNSYPSPTGSQGDRAVSWEEDDYYSYFQNYGWQERAHRIPGRKFLERAYQTYSLL